MNPRQKSVIVGVVLGATLGGLGGFLFTRGLQMPREEGGPREFSLQSIPPGEMVKLFIAILAVLRGVAELGERI